MNWHSSWIVKTDYCTDGFDWKINVFYVNYHKHIFGKHAPNAAKSHESLQITNHAEIWPASVSSLKIDAFLYCFVQYFWGTKGWKVQQLRITNKNSVHAHVKKNVYWHHNNRESFIHLLY